jgi:DNA-binding MarR family transcriptional regulator
MFQTLAYYSSAFYKDFTDYAGSELQRLGINYGALFFVLYVGKHPGCPPSELTKALRADWGHSQRSITKLVEDGFMTKEKSGRTYHLHLTEKGLRTFQVSHQVFFDWDQASLACLTDAERTDLFVLLGKIAHGKKEARKCMMSCSYEGGAEK